MAWNGSGDTGRARTPSAPQKKSGASSPLWLKGALAGLVVVAIGAAVLYKMRPAEKPVEKVRKAAKKETIASVTPAPAPKYEAPKVEVVTNRHGKVVPKRKPETYKDERGVLRYKKGNGRVPPPDAHKYLIKSRQYEDNMPHFNHQVETEIAAILMHQPGDAAFGDFPHDKAFKKDFVAALMEPIEILDTDSEADKKLKQEVEQAKHELAQRLKNGEDVGEILQEARDEMRRMSVYKNEVIDMVHEQIKNEARTTADVDTYYEAMNKMLEAKGIEPVKMSGLMRRKIGYDLMKQQEEAEKAANPPATKENE